MYSIDYIGSKLQIEVSNSNKTSKMWFVHICKKISNEKSEAIIFKFSYFIFVKMYLQTLNHDISFKIALFLASAKSESLYFDSSAGKQCIIMGDFGRSSKYSHLHFHELK